MRAGFFLFLNAVFSSVMAQPDSQNESSAPRFYYELANAGAHDSTLSCLQVYVSVLQSELVFLPTTHSFEAEYKITITIANSKGVSVAAREENARLEAAGREETRSRRKYAFHRFTFELPPGEYSTHILLEDQVSKLQSSVIVNKILRNFNPMYAPLAVSDAVWLEHSGAEPEAYVPTLFENTITPSREFALYLEIHSTDMQTPLYVRQIIRNAQKQIVLDQQRPWKRRDTIEKLILPIETDLLSYGTFEVEMMIRQGVYSRGALAAFRLDWDGIPTTALHLNHALGAAQYLATKEERQLLQAAMSELPLADKRVALENFWRPRDTTPETSTNEAMASFYERLVIANDRFGGEKLGWQTDLGRVYLTQGPPDEIQMHAKTTATQPFQVWRYHQSQREFLFVDRKGIGSFQLASKLD